MWNVTQRRATFRSEVWIRFGLRQHATYSGVRSGSSRGSPLRHPQPFWHKMAPTIAEGYLKRARRGLMAPEEIEAELAAKNLPPLAVFPDPGKFDPNLEVWWTLAMAAAWIIWRTPDAVRRAWWKYRREVRQWVGPQDLLVESEGQPQFGYQGTVTETVSGYTLESWRELDLFGVLLRSTLERQTNPVIEGEAARLSLWRKLESGELVAEAIRSGEADRNPIRDADWIDLDHFQQVGWPANSIGMQYEKSPRFLAVRVRRLRVIELWPTQAPEAEKAVARSSARRLHDRREAIRRAHAALWPNGVPIGLLVKQRDAMIQERLKADGLLPPASRTIARALDDVSRERV